MAFFDHEGIRFHYETRGSGYPLILNHGLGGDLTQPMDLLGEVPGFQTIYWDCRGHGETEPVGPPEGFSFPQFSRDLGALTGELGIDKAVLGGISMGAALSTRFVVDHPEKVRALLLIRPAWLDSPNPPHLEMAQHAAGLLATKGVQGAIEDEDAFCSIPESLHCAFRDQIQKPKAVERRFRLERMPASAPIQNWVEVKEIQCPTLVVGNDRDPVHPLDYAKTWAEKFENAQFVQVISKTEDFDRHQEEVRQVIVQFLEKNVLL